jgi:MFS family permease
MRPRPLPLVCLALLLLALAWGLAGRREPLPAGDEATPVMMVQSLWLDHDLTYRQADLDRAQALWGGGPAGLTLFTNDGGKTLRYGQPLVYPLAALPFYAVFGVRGIALLNMALFLAMAIAALWLLAEDTGAPLFVAGFFFASAALAYAFRLEPDVFLMACVFFPLLAWRRLERQNLALLAGAGILLGAAVTASPLLGLLGLPILIDLAARRRWRGLAALVAGIVLAAGLLALVQRVGTGEWSAFGGAQRRTFDTKFPLESPRDLWQGYRAEETSPEIATGLRLLPRNLLYLVAGRYTGLLPYFPFALFALILFLVGRKDRPRHLLATALLLYAGLVLILNPHDFAGAPGFLGSRPFALVYPAFLFLPRRLEARRALAFPYLAAGLWTAVALLQAPFHTTASTFQRLPLELTLLPGDHLPGYTAQTWGDAVWIVPREAFFVEERHPHGVWVRGGTRSEVIVISPQPLSRLAFTVYSLSAANVLTLDGGAGRLTVRFDTEGKRDGTPVDLPLAPAARDLGFFPTGHELYYRLTLETTAGLVPARVDPKSQDPRNLGVFLGFTGEGP